MCKKMVSFICCFTLIFSMFGFSVFAANNLRNADVNSDGLLNAEDLTELRQILLGVSNSGFFDVNGDEECNIIDLVAAKKIVIAESEKNDKYISDNWYF